ncbi:hypothetical protein NP493_500g02014 [Ridgeia piscesae]|uniref:Uncharacterized protein n=1 Tax=Ridgeia piscesae TaxID=27915 RepID=A0AAD9KX45_RIDPI|nr:hypothetical protein NP493_500g02014 [Ridgeia piscesae]
MKLGRNVARTFLDYYKLLGYISTKPSSGLLPKPSHHSAKERKHQENRAASEPLRQTIDERYDHLVQNSRLVFDQPNGMSNFDNTVSKLRA